jgi:ABC-type sugar transport system permease subunit
MLIWQWILSGIVLLLAIPTGIIIAKATKEELKAGRNCFLALMILSFIAFVMGLFFKIKLESKLLSMFTAGFMFIVSLISYKRSFRKRKKK